MSGKSLPVDECFEIKSQFYDNYQPHSDGCPLDALCLCSPEGRPLPARHNSLIHRSHAPRTRRSRCRH